MNPHRCRASVIRNFVRQADLSASNLHKNTKQGDSIDTRYLSADISLDVTHKVLPVDNSKDVSVNVTNKDTSADNSRERVTIDVRLKDLCVVNSQKNVSIDLRKKDLPVDDLHSNLCLDVTNKDLSAHNSQKNVSVDAKQKGLSNRNISIDIRQRDLSIENSHKNIPVDVTCKDINADSIHRNVSIDCTYKYAPAHNNVCYIISHELSHKENSIDITSVKSKDLSAEVSEGFTHISKGSSIGTSQKDLFADIFVISENQSGNIKHRNIFTDIRHKISTDVGDLPLLEGNLKNGESIQDFPSKSSVMNDSRSRSPLIGSNNVQGRVLRRNKKKIKSFSESKPDLSPVIGSQKLKVGRDRSDSSAGLRSPILALRQINFNNKENSTKQKITETTSPILGVSSGKKTKYKRRNLIREKSLNDNANIVNICKNLFPEDHGNALNNEIEIVSTSGSNKFTNIEKSDSGSIVESDRVDLSMISSKDLTDADDGSSNCQILDTSNLNFVEENGDQSNMYNELNIEVMTSQEPEVRSS